MYICTKGIKTRRI